MLSFFKSKASKDFEKAMDFLECSRTLMSNAIETHRAIVEHNSDELVGLLELAAVVEPADAFLKENLEKVSKQLDAWKLRMQLEQPGRYRKIERIINNAEKNMRVAREKTIHIDHWVQFDRLAATRTP